MLFDYDWLCAPIVPPEGVDDPRPVLPQTHAAAFTSIRAAAMWLNVIAQNVEDAPWADGLFDECDKIAGEMLRTAGAAMVLFRLSRDCQGRG
jgi:hypothetical protein